jgi:hypothetical protein
MYKVLKTKKIHFDGDFGKYDGSAPSQLQDAIVDIVLNFFIKKTKKIKYKNQFNFFHKKKKKKFLKKKKKKTFQSSTTNTYKKTKFA